MNGGKQMDKVYKNTGTLDELILSGLESEEDIKEWLTINLEEYEEDKDIQTFIKCIEYAIIAKGKIAKHSQRKTTNTKKNITAIINSDSELQLNTVLKIFKELGYSLKVA